ncbi:MAG: 4-hydroxy-tetrahydrodipicolinate reductase [Defluviitaleaceae bacterium]|nr:4-hydroxy-tetrahydrodipicolinate reductase [Defluviitaleaceae bacterium]
MTKIILSGAYGQMGLAVGKLAKRGENVNIVAGMDYGKTDEHFSFPVFNSMAEVPGDLLKADAVVDFSGVSALDSVIGFGLKNLTPLVICTTGLDVYQEETVKEAAKKIAVFKSANMSVGVSLLAGLAEKAARLLYGAGFDVEIIEKHHNQKIDAPSGTALMLAQKVNAAADGNLQNVFDRSCKKQKRGKNEIGIHALRGGTIVGEHSVIFAGADEIIELKHCALSREVFAAGALRAAEFIKNKPPGLYSMKELVDEA